MSWPGHLYSPILHGVSKNSHFQAACELHLVPRAGSVVSGVVVGAGTGYLVVGVPGTWYWVWWYPGSGTGQWYLAL